MAKFEIRVVGRRREAIDVKTMAEALVYLMEHLSDAEGGMAVAKIRERLTEVQRKRDAVSARMESKIDQLEAGMRVVEGALVRGQFEVPAGGHQKSPPLGMSFRSFGL
jgi:hypothetical protein